MIIIILQVTNFPSPLIWQVYEFITQQSKKNNITHSKIKFYNAFRDLSSNHQPSEEKWLAALMRPNGGGTRLPQFLSTKQSGAWHPRKQQYLTSTAVRTSNLNSSSHPLKLSASYAAAVHILVSTYPASSYLPYLPQLLYFSRFAHSIASANFKQLRS